MGMVLVDDDIHELKKLLLVVQSVCNQSEIACFTNAKQCLLHAKEHDIEIAFLNVEMKHQNGLELARKLKELQPYINIIFVTSNTRYAVDAFALRSSGYLLKPVTKDDVQDEIKHLRIPYPVKPCVRVQTFGNFEVFINNQILMFTRAKEKELLAYLVDRKGASVSMGELAGVLWEDKPFSISQKSYLRTLISELISILRTHHVEDMIIKKYNYIAVDVTKFACDYYDFLQMKASAVNAFGGEYMTNYSWAEFTLSTLEQRYTKKGG